MVFIQQVVAFHRNTFESWNEKLSLIIHSSEVWNLIKTVLWLPSFIFAFYLVSAVCFLEHSSNGVVIWRNREVYRNKIKVKLSIL